MRSPGSRALLCKKPCPAEQDPTEDAHAVCKENGGCCDRAGVSDSLSIGKNVKERKKKWLMRKTRSWSKKM